MGEKARKARPPAGRSWAPAFRVPVRHLALLALFVVGGLGFVARTSGLQRVAEVPIYSADAIARRAPALQKTRDAATPVAAMHAEELKRIGVSPGEKVKVSQGENAVVMVAAADSGLPAGVARVAAGHAVTAGLGAMFGNVTVERA